MGSIYILQAAQCRSGQWFNLNWKDCYRKVKSLQIRIVKFVRKREWHKAKRLSILLIGYNRRKHVVGASIEMGVSHA